jgi:hypothetical protein
LKDDNTFVFVDNLKAFLKTKNPNDYFSYGYNFIVNGGYHSGGPGYVIGNRAMKLIGKELDENDTQSCPSTGTEDMDVANCLRVCLFIDSCDSSTLKNIVYTCMLKECQCDHGYIVR